MDELEKILERVARATYKNVFDDYYYRGGASAESVIEIFKSYLLPLLQAGEALRDWDGLSEHELTRLQRAWDVAKAKLLGGADGH